jgi:hypothetical protein
MGRIAYWRQLPMRQAFVAHTVRPKTAWARTEIGHIFVDRLAQLTWRQLNSPSPAAFSADVAN